MSRKAFNEIKARGGNPRYAGKVISRQSIIGEGESDSTMTVKITSKRQTNGTTQSNFIKHVRHHSELGMIGNANSQYFNHVVQEDTRSQSSKAI